MEELMKYAGEFGIIAVAFLYMLWNQQKNNEALREDMKEERSEMRAFLNEMKDNYSKMAESIAHLSEDIDYVKDELRKRS